MGAVEHITLDGGADPGAAPADGGHRPTLRRHAIAGRQDGCQTELSILEGHYLRVRDVGPRNEPRVYQFDLRFADPAPVRVRRMPRALLLAATGLAASGLGALVAAWPALRTALGPVLTGGLIAAVTGIVAVYVCLRWTRESLQLRSAYGSAVLVSVTGRLGSARGHHPVFAEVSRSVLAARNARPQDKPQFLRDAMREHYRLRKLGVLSEENYEAAKAAILAAH